MAEALIAGGSAVIVALIGYLGVRVPMKREHAENGDRLGYIAGQVDRIVHQVDETESKLDDHIASHARGDFTDND